MVFCTNFTLIKRKNENFKYVIGLTLKIEFLRNISTFENLYTN